MKKGKNLKIAGHKSFKINYGTVDSKNLKSIYIVLQTWIEPLTLDENWNRLVGEIKRQIQHTLLEVVDTQTFERKHRIFVYHIVRIFRL
jgi:hypothetical protein